MSGDGDGVRKWYLDLEGVAEEGYRKVNGGAGFTTSSTAERMDRDTEFFHFLKSCDEKNYVGVGDFLSFARSEK